MSEKRACWKTICRRADIVKILIYVALHGVNAQLFYAPDISTCSEGPGHQELHLLLTCLCIFIFMDREKKTMLPNFSSNEKQMLGRFIMQIWFWLVWKTSEFCTFFYVILFTLKCKNICKLLNERICQNNTLYRDSVFKNIFLYNTMYEDFYGKNGNNLKKKIFFSNSLVAHLVDRIVFFDDSWMATKISDTRSSNRYFLLFKIQIPK